MEEVDIKRVMIEKVARNLGCSPKQVETIIKTQSAYIKHVMESGSMEGVALPYLGKFIVSPKKLKKINEASGLKRAKEVWDYSKKKPVRSK